MSQVLIHGFDSIHTCQGIRRLIDEKGSGIAAWIGEAEFCTHNIFDLFAGRFSYVNKPIPLSVLNAVSEHLYEVLFAVYRHYKVNIEVDVYELHNLLQKATGLLFDLITGHGVDLILFSNLPHEGIDNISYVIAKSLGIRTVLCHQSPFPGQYFVLEDLDDFGRFATSRVDTLRQVTAEEIEALLTSFTLPPFYMSDLPPRDIPRLLERRTLTSLRRFYRAKARRKRRVTYHRNLDSITTAAVRVDIPFVYFPLHLQPELTTCPMGGAFFDQALAIECLHARLPAGWKIYAKENPKQTEFMRGTGFFERLRLLENLEFVPRDTPSHALIRAAQVVATITGTAGMEALVVGKPVVVFGKAWYGGFSGVFPYQDSLDLLSLPQQGPSPSTVRRELATVLPKIGKGIVDPAYRVTASEYSVEKNNQEVYETMKKYLGCAVR